MFIVDGHCDTIQLALDKNLDLSDKSLSFNLNGALENTPIIQMMAAFVNPSYKNSFKRACDIISYFEKQINKYPQNLIHIRKSEDIKKVENENKIGCLLTIENGSAIEDNIENINYFYKKGVKVMSVTWNEDNLLGCGAHTKNDNGLTEFGKKYIKELNKKKIIVDVSHSSEKTFWDVIDTSVEPIVATHSCCYTLCTHPRNLKDEQIKAIAEKDGIIGVCYCKEFLSNNKTAGTKEIVEHIAYIANLVGVDYVGLGSDFDGLEEKNIPNNLRNIGQINNLIKELEKVGFSKQEICKIMGENWLAKLCELC